MKLWGWHADVTNCHKPRTVLITVVHLPEAKKANAENFAKSLRLSEADVECNDHQPKHVLVRGRVRQGRILKRFPTAEVSHVRYTTGTRDHGLPFVPEFARSI